MVSVCGMLCVGGTRTMDLMVVIRFTFLTATTLDQPYLPPSNRWTCSHLYTEGEVMIVMQSYCANSVDIQELSLCCSLRQLEDLKQNFATPQQLIEERCPICWYNFRKNFCDMTCIIQSSSMLTISWMVQGLILVTATTPVRMLPW